MPPFSLGFLRSCIESPPAVYGGMPAWLPGDLKHQSLVASLRVPRFPICWARRAFASLFHQGSPSPERALLTSKTVPCSDHSSGAEPSPALHAYFWTGNLGELVHFQPQNPPSILQELAQCIDKLCCRILRISLSLCVFFVCGMSQLSPSMHFTRSRCKHIPSIGLCWLQTT